MKNNILFISMVCLLLNQTAWAHQTQETHTSHTQYLGNEAVLVYQNDKKLLFDPFFHSDFGIYQRVPEKVRQDIKQGKAPFDGIDIVLVSHAHGDHFAADDMLVYLLAQTEVILIAPQQAVTQLAEQAGYEQVAARVIGVSLARGDDFWRQTVKGLDVEGVRIPHAGWPGRADVENLVFRVSFGANNSVLHMGDADPLVDHYLPYRQHWQANPTQLGFPPYWFYQSMQGRDILDEYMNIQKTIGIHVPVTAPGWLQRQQRDYFSQPGELRGF